MLRVPFCEADHYTVYFAKPVSVTPVLFKEFFAGSPTPHSLVPVGSIAINRIIVLPWARNGTRGSVPLENDTSGEERWVIVTSSMSGLMSLTVSRGTSAPSSSCEYSSPELCMYGRSWSATLEEAGGAGGEDHIAMAGGVMAGETQMRL